MTRTAIALLAVALLAAPALASAEGAVEEVARVGTLDGSPETLFGRISHVCALHDGGVIVADYQLEQIRAYDAAGRHVGDIGSAGEGPGEYERVRGMRLLPGGQLVTLSAPARLSFFDVATRQYVKDFNLDSYTFSPRMLAHDDEGFVYVRAVKGEPRPGGEWAFEWLKLNPLGGIAGRIPIPHERPSHPAFALMFPEGTRGNFVTKTLSAWSPAGYFVTGRNDAYKFMIEAPGGPIEVTRNMPPVKLGDEERREWLAWAEYFEGDYEIPRVKPAYREIDVDMDGRIWVHRYVEAMHFDQPPRSTGDKRPTLSWREPTVLDVFTPEGEFLRTVELPRLTKVDESACVGEHIWGVQSTDAGEQLVHWRVPGLGSTVR